MDNLKDRLVDKSIEAFILGLEIYNKPTIKYRIEGIFFFHRKCLGTNVKSYNIGPRRKHLFFGQA